MLSLLLWAFKWATLCVRGWYNWLLKISDCRLEAPRFNPWPGQGLNFGRPSFATLSVERDIKPLV